MTVKHDIFLPVPEKGHGSAGAKYSSSHGEQDNFHHLPSLSVGNVLSLSLVNINSCIQCTFNYFSKFL